MDFSWTYQGKSTFATAAVRSAGSRASPPDTWYVCCSFQTHDRTAVNTFRRVTLHLKESVSSLCGMQSQLSEKVDFVQQKVEEICVKMPCTQQKIYATDPFSENSASTRPYFEQPTKLSDYTVLKKIGIFGTASSFSSNNEKSNAISVTVSFPWFLGCRAITAQFLVKWLKSSLFSMQLSRGILSVRNVVSDESRIMVDCERGDVPVVQQLLQTKRASPHDITATGRTPLLVSCWSSCYRNSW